jgi:hypothetical protein
MPKVQVKLGARLMQRDERKAPTPQEVLTAWANGDPEPFCRALWLAGPRFLAREKDFLKVFTDAGRMPYMVTKRSGNGGKR